MQKVLNFISYPGITCVNSKCFDEKNWLKPRKQQLLPPTVTLRRSSTPHCPSCRRTRPCSSGPASSPPWPSGCTPRSVRRQPRGHLLRFWFGSNPLVLWFVLWLAARILRGEERLQEQGWMLSSCCFRNLLRSKAD